MRPELTALLDRLPEVDTSLADTFEPHGPFKEGIPMFAVLHWWTVTPWDWSADQPADGKALAKLEWMKARPGVGSYHGVEFGGTPYQTSALMEKAWHAGGSPGLRDTNSRSVGFAIATPSPSMRPRRIEGEVQRPWFNRADKTMGRAWYPPVSERSLLAAVAFFRWWQQKAGVQFSGVYLHHHINPQKNDLRNMDAPHNTGLVFGDFLALVKA